MKIILEFDNTKDAKLALDAPKLKSVIDQIEEYINKLIEGVDLDEGDADDGMIEGKTDKIHAYTEIYFKLTTLVHDMHDE